MTDSLPKYEDLLQFAVDCAHHPLVGDFEKIEGLWVETTEVEEAVAVEFYEGTVEWARTLVGMEGPQHFAEDGSLEG